MSAPESGALQASDAVKAPRKVLIDGEWRASGTYETTEIVDPSYGSHIATAAACNAQDVDAAARAAHEAFEDGCWRRDSAASRAGVLQRVAQLIEEQAEELANLEVTNGGTLAAAARQGELPFAAACFRYYASLCDLGADAPRELVAPTSSGFDAWCRREPVGVAGLIVPWNGPLVQAAWKLAPALAAGCSAVLKPDEKTPLSALRLGELLQRAGVPDGVVNIVTGGPRTGAEIVRHPLVSKISFTGSTATGREIAAAAATDLTRLTLELGGKSPVIVLADADLEAAARGAAEAIFSHAGQVCVAGSRLYIEAPVFDEVVERIVDHAAGTVVGPADRPETTMGPLISARHLARVLARVNAAEADGAELLTGGRRLECGGGFYMSPAVFLVEDQSLPVCCEEIFGPVLAVARASDADHCVRLANDSRYGLAASVWSRDEDKARRIAASLAAGIVWINAHGIPNPALPFGGYRQSGWGRELGPEGLLEYTELKSVMRRTAT